MKVVTLCVCLLLHVFLTVCCHGCANSSSKRKHENEEENPNISYIFDKRLKLESSDNDDNVAGTEEYKIDDSAMDCDVSPFSSAPVLPFQGATDSYADSSSTSPSRQILYGIDELDANGFAPLHRAVMCNRLSEVEQLIEAGANVNLKGAHGSTPLLLACEQNLVDMAALLLNKNADVDISGDQGLAPIHIVIYYNYHELTALLLGFRVNLKAQLGNGKVPLYIAVEEKRVEIAVLLLKHEADPNIEFGNGKFTPLYIAVRNNCYEIVASLLEHKASINAPIATGETPLHAAVRNGQCNMVALLVYYKQPASVHARTHRDHVTPLHIAAKIGHYPIVSLLLLRGAYPNAITTTGETPLVIAVQKNHWGITNLLLSYRADFNVIFDWHSLVYIAIANRHHSIAMLLLGKGAQTLPCEEGIINLFIDCVKHGEFVCSHNQLN